MLLRIVLLLVAATTAVSCAREAEVFDADQYEAEIKEWRADRLARLKGPSGYLNLAGLFWLSKGSVLLGSAPDNDIILPASAAARLGVLHVSDTGVVLDAANGAEVFADGRPVSSILVADDTTAAPVTITHGSIAWTIIKRDMRFGLRLRDFEHPAIAAFPPIDYYPIDASLRVVGELRRYDTPRIVDVDTVIEGLGWHPESPGVVHFELGGQALQLEAYASDDELFFVFGDRTSGRETYPAGRFLYARLPGADGRTVLDFNKAYNPPCAFNDFATCPVASPRNRLAVRIEGGERFDPAIHATPDSSH